MSLSSAKAKLDAQGGDPVAGYISKTDHQQSYDELVDDTALTGATTAEALDVAGALTAGTVASDATVAGTGLAGGLLSSANPVINGVAAPGTSAIPSRQDHVHASDTTKVTGPASATDNALVRFDGAGGKTVQNSGITVDDSNNVSGVGTFASGAITSSAAVQAAAASGFVSGASGPKIGLSGTGSPEGVVTAPVGSDYRDTSATTGAIKWIKATGTGNTGWVVEYGDTGSRDISSVLTADADRTLATTILLRRTGNRVVLLGIWRETTTTPNNRAFYSLPVGFRPSHTLYQYVPYDAASTSAYRNIRVPANGNITYGGPTSGSNFEYHVQWTTPDAWPSSLPGSAA